MKLLSVCLLAFLFLPAIAAPAAKDAARTNRRTIHAKQRRWRADELKEHHRLMRKTHKDYMPNYPDAPILTSMTVGTPAVEYTVALETGTTDLFLLSKDYPARADNQSFYDPAQSSTSIEAGYYWGWTGDLQAMSWSYYDVVGLFEFETNTTQRFGVVTDVYSPAYTNPTMPDGVLGMSWDPEDAANPNENSSAIVNLFNEWQEPNRYWVEWIADISSPEDGRMYDLVLSFGSFLDDLCEPMASDDSIPLVWFSGLDTLQFAIDSFTYKGHQWGAYDARVDTGVPNILLPYDPFLAIIDDVQPDYDFDTGIYTVDCSRAGSLPDWVFTIGGKNDTIPSTAYVVDLFLPNGQCALSIGWSDDSTTPVVLGYVFHTLFCIKMDIDNQTIGFSKALPSSAPSAAGGARPDGN